MGSREITDLPNEILFSIFSYLKMFDLKFIIPKVCKRWESLSTDKRLWRRLTYETTSEGTKTFGAKSWESTIKFLETTPQLQNVVISQGHSDAEVREILTTLEKHCEFVRQIEMEITPQVIDHLVSLTKLTNIVESLRLSLVLEHSQKKIFKSLSQFKNLRSVTFVASNPQHKDFKLFIENVPHLQDLNVSNDEFCKTNFIMLLKRKEQFRRLFLRVDSLDRSCISELSTFPNLNGLNLVESNASAGKLYEIGQLSCLETFLLREDVSSPVVTSSSLTKFLLIGTFEKLKELKLHKSRLDDEGAAAIRRNCPVLIYLEVITYPKSRSDLTEKALIHFLHCPRLESFEITFDSSSETDWMFRRIRYVKHECDIDGVCPVSLNEHLLSWDEVQIPMD